jgi:hypothetical protein
MIRDTSNEYLRRLTIQIENNIVSIFNFVSTVNLLLTGKIAQFDSQLFITKLKELKLYIVATSNFYESFSISHQIIKVDKNLKLSSRDNQMVESLLSSLEMFQNQFQLYEGYISTISQKLQPIVARQNTSVFNHQILNSEMILSNSDKNSLLLTGTNLLKICYDLKVLLNDIRPSNDKNSSPDQDNIFLSIYQAITQMSEGPKGVSILALPMMRDQLKRAYGMEEVPLTGSSGQFIDAVYIPPQVCHFKDFYILLNECYDYFLFLEKLHEFFR